MMGARRTRAGLFAVVMMLLTLGAVALVSAGAEHHTLGGVALVSEHHTRAAATETSHDHQTGTEWTPTPVHRLRPAADVTGGSIVPAGTHAQAPVDLVVTAGEHSRGGEASSSVLRV